MDDGSGIFDDTDPRIAYVPADQWIRGGTQDEHNATTHGSLATGAQVRVAFTGTSIAVYGTLIHTTREVVSTYTLDASRPATFTAPHWTPPPNASTSRAQQLFFRSPALPEGRHTLLVMGVVADSGFWVDYFNVTGREPGLLDWDEAAGSDAGATPTSTPTPPKTRTKNTPTGAIAGGVAGGVIALAVAVVLLWYWRRRRRALAMGARDDGIPRTPGTPGTQYTVTTRGGTAAEKTLQSPRLGEEERGGGQSVVDSPPAYDVAVSPRR